MTALFISNSQGLAQGFDLNLGWYSGINAAGASPTYALQKWTVEKGMAYLFGLHFGNLLEVENRSRLGIKLNLQSAKSKPRNPSEENDALRSGIRYQMTTIWLSYQRKLYQSNPLIIALDLSGGFSFFSSKLASGLDHCDSPFCGLPEIRISLAPGLVYLRSQPASRSCRRSPDRRHQVYGDAVFAPKL